MYFLVYQIFWYYNASLFSIGGKTLTASTGFTLAFFVLYFFKHEKYVYPKERIPFFLPLVLICLSAFATCFTSLAGFSSELTRCLSTRICPNVLVIWLAWQLIETEADYRWLFKAVTITMFVACVFGLLEYATKSNLLFDMKSALASAGISNYNTKSNLDATMRGYRLMSLFEHPVGAGMTFGLYFAFAASVFVKERNKVPNSKVVLITALMCLACVVLTKMRSAIVFAVIASVSFVNFKKKKFYKIVILIVLGLFAAWPLLSNQIGLILSIFNSNYQASVGGSSLEMRLSQFEAVFRVMSLSPVAGLGESFKNYINNSITLGTLGYESIWFEQMVQHGMIGVIANIILMVYSIVIIPVRYRSKELFYISLAYWVTTTLTGSEILFRIHLYYLAMFFYIKSSDIYQNQKTLIKRPIRFTLGR